VTPFSKIRQNGLLGEIIETVSGISYSEYMNKNIFPSKNEPYGGVDFNGGIYRACIGAFWTG
jgi:hypothetical protein